MSMILTNEKYNTIEYKAIPISKTQRNIVKMQLIRMVFLNKLDINDEIQIRKIKNNNKMIKIAPIEWIFSEKDKANKNGIENIIHG